MVSEVTSLERIKINVNRLDDMENLRDYIESGILESYVLGIASSEEVADVERMAERHKEILLEIDAISLAIEKFALENAVTPDPLIKPFVMASIDYMNRMMAGEEPSFPPVLNSFSVIKDYSQWLNRPDMVLPETFDNIYAKIIGYGPQGVTAITWIKEMAPQEMHDDEYESFLIVEGTCDIIIDGELNSLAPGDYLSIPLYKEHSVKVTSSQPCKVILQRLAA